MPENTVDRLRERLTPSPPQGASVDALRSRLAQPQSVPFGATPPGAQPTTLALGGGSTAPDPRAFERALELADPALQGLTFGFGDELTSLASGVPIEEVRQRSERIREEQPGAALAAELGGGLFTASRLGPAGAAIPVLRSAPSLVRFGAGGAAAGAVAGAGTAEGGPQERLAGAGQGAAIGAGLGVVLPVVGRGAAAVLTPLLNRTQGATRQAIERIQRALQRDEMTVEDARDELQTLGVNATIADAGGENIRGLAQAVQSTPGPARNAIRNFLETRQSGQVNRVAETINDTLGRGGEFRMSRGALMQARRESSQVLYDGAYEIGIPATEELRELLSRPSAQAALRNAYRLAADEGVILPQITDDAGNLLIGEGRAIPTQVLDYVQRGLTDALRSERNAITGAIETQAGVAVNRIRQDLLRIMDRDNPVFAAARAVYAGDSASIAALEQGRRLGRGLGRQSDEFDPEQIYDDLAQMNEGERAFFRQGLARGLVDAVEATSDTADAVRRIVGTEARRGRLRAAFPDGETFTRFMSDLTAEQRFFRTRTDVLAGSQTQPRLAAQADLGSALPERSPFEGGALASLARGAGALGRRVTRASPQTIEEIGRVLFTPGPEATRLIDIIGATPAVPPALQRGGLAALIETERQGASFPNR